ncbi:hypothetical protein KZZ04_02865 [Pseudoalteromonas sp. CR1]|uniref:hypothetical protein n=1 Tax=Pseudoalteromonas sp. CR1 TaxID=2861964 RepID=UPI001C5E17AA|nr:hypothetical protein [Pseudoalteromonas sp. CR1]MBW4965307.1 hypothetical protein [Pseudoalteromonas sp. CR1]
MSEEKCDWILAPHMIETSYLYLKSSELMWPYSISISIVNSALALEILLKSFNCRVINDEQYEKYQFNSKVLNKGENAHDLMHLYDALPDTIKHKLSNDFDLDLIKKYRHTFTNSRCIYEKNAITGGSTALMEMTALLLRKTVGFT